MWIKSCHIPWFSFLLLLLQFTKIEGQSVIGNYIRFMFEGSPLTEIILHFLEGFREGLIKANAGHLQMPNISWIVNGGHIHGAIQSYEMAIKGLTDFKIHNATTSVLSQTLDLDVEVPDITLQGNYRLAVSFLGLPLWGAGRFAILIQRLRGGFEAELVGISTSSAINITEPFLSVKEIHIEVDGLLSNISPFILFLIFTLGFISFVVTIVLLTLYHKDIMNTISGRYKRYRSVS